MARTSRLPRVVPFRYGAKVYSASSREDVAELARDIKALSPSQAVTFAATMLEMRLMMPPLLYRIPAWIAVKRGWCELRFWTVCFTRPKYGTPMLRAMIDDTARWVVSGTDTEQRTSVGGFSQREINFMAGVLSILGELEAKRAA